MSSLSYKTFVWTQNPHTYKEEYIRTPKFKTVDGESEYSGMGEMQRIITGSGVFFGETAYEDFQALAALFEESSAGNLVHPVWGIRYCYFTGLELTQEPKDNCISYKFEFTGALTNGTVPR